MCILDVLRKARIQDIGSVTWRVQIWPLEARELDLSYKAAQSILINGRQVYSRDAILWALPVYVLKVL